MRDSIRSGLFTLIGSAVALCSADAVAQGDDISPVAGLAGVKRHRYENKVSDGMYYGPTAAAKISDATAIALASHRTLDIGDTGRHCATYPMSRSIKYSFTMQNTTNRPVEKAQLWSYAPVKKTSTQRTESVDASYPFELLVDELGNQILQFTWYDIPPYGSKLVTVSCVVRSSQVASSMTDGQASVFLGPEQYVECNAPEIISVAQAVAARQDDRTALRAFEWIVDNIARKGFTREDRGALHAISTQSGDCTELMYLFVALCRAQGIPARGVGGYVLTESARLNPDRYHNWAEAFIDGAWWIVDPHRRIFRAQQGNYVAMRIISGKLQTQMGSAHRFLANGDGVEVRMR